jgi:RNA polymerase sigma-70 factor (ECF subfamily)
MEDQAQSGQSTPHAGEISRLAEHLFRHESGKLVSVLTGIFGIERLQLAEDVVQEALVRALQTWPYYGVPKNPAAWLTQTAKHLALDTLRRETLFQKKQPLLTVSIEQSTLNTLADESAVMDSEIRDDRLRLMFACCHPLLPQDAQAALALKTLCGFSPAEIAKAFLANEGAITKRLTRARQKIRDLKIPFEIPAGAELVGRLDAVLQTLYLLFNEGYKASSGDHLVRKELCDEAIRLATLLSEHAEGNQPRTHALLALMILNAARLSARSDSEGNLLRLQDQNRSLWDRQLIVRGMFHLSQSAAGDELTVYHLQAGIAACHCVASNYESTDWEQILSLYDELLKIEYSPVVALNRAVAVAEVHGPRAGLLALQAIHQRQALESYYLYYAVSGDLEAKLGNHQAAAAQLEKAIQLTDLKVERTFLERRLNACSAAAT